MPSCAGDRLRKPPVFLTPSHLEDSGVCAMISPMAKLKIHQCEANRRKKRIVPLSKLQAPDVMKTVIRHPRRLEELLDMLGDKDLILRSRAAAILASLAESCPERLIKVMARLQECLGDDSDYVRWHLFYALGELSIRFPVLSKECWSNVFVGMSDNSRIVRMVAGKAAVRLATAHPTAVAAVYRNSRREIPPEIAVLLPQPAATGGVCTVAETLPYASKP